MFFKDVLSFQFCADSRFAHLSRIKHARTNATGRMKKAGVKERKQQIHCSMAKHFAAPDRKAASPARGDECHRQNVNTALTFMYLNPLKFIKVAAFKIPLTTSR